MDVIRLGCAKSNLEDYTTTTIHINGINLEHIIEGIESEQFVRQGLHAPNSCYEGISFFIAFHYQNHFLCKTLKDYVYNKDWYTLYDYKYSGIPGEHSLTCKIAIEKKKVLWYDFKNFSKIIPFPLDYGNLKFCFDLEQYFHAIATVKNNSQENRFA